MIRSCIRSSLQNSNNSANRVWKHGLDFLADLRKEEAFKATPVIILSNMSGDEDRRRAAELGVVGYFVKADFALDELVEQIAEVLNKK